MAFNEKKYLKYFAKSNLIEEEKLERIRIYKGILQTFVDAAFGQHPVQLCHEPSKERYLQSQDQEVESQKVSKKFNQKTIGPLRQKPHPKNEEKDTVHHVKPI